MVKFLCYLYCCFFKSHSVSQQSALYMVHIITQPNSSILCSSFAKFGIILFFGGGFQASWAEEERGG
jgi:hypothetical protein